MQLDYYSVTINKKGGHALSPVAVMPFKAIRDS